MYDKLDIVLDTHAFKNREISYFFAKLSQNEARFPEPPSSFIGKETAFVCSGTIHIPDGNNEQRRACLSKPEQRRAANHVGDIKTSLPRLVPLYQLIICGESGQTHFCCWQNS